MGRSEKWFVPLERCAEQGAVMRTHRLGCQCQNCRFDVPRIPLIPRSSSLLDAVAEVTNLGGDDCA